MVERIIFFVLSLGLFMYLFFKMVKKNDTNYLYILIIEAIGVAIGFVSLIMRAEFNIVITIITYIISVILPIAIIVIEIAGITFTEAIYLVAARWYLKKDEPDKARKLLLKLVEKEPKSYYAHKELARQYELEEKYDLALDEYIRISNIRHGEDDITFKIADMFYKTGKPEESVPILTDLLKRKPEMENATFLLCDIYYEQEKFKEAVNIYLNALKYHPDNYDIYYNLGMCYTRLNDFQSAKEYYEKAAELNNLLYLAKYNLGQIALLYNELDEAEDYFVECLQDEDLEEDAYFYLAYIAMLRGDENKAVSYLNTAVDENPEIYDTIRKELIFKVIIFKIDKPNMEQKPKRKPAKITKKDKETMKHLKNMYDLVGNLNNNDIKAISKIISKRKEEKELGLDERE